MQTKLSFWPTFIFGPLYLGWRGFLKEAVLLFLGHVVISFFVIEILLFGIPEPLITILSYILMFAIHYLAFRYWPKYISRFMPKQFNRPVSFTATFLIYFGFPLYFAIGDVAIEHGIDKMTVIRRISTNLFQRDMTTEDWIKVIKAFEGISGR